MSGPPPLPSRLIAIAALAVLPLVGCTDDAATGVSPAPTTPSEAIATTPSTLVATTTQPTPPSTSVVEVDTWNPILADTRAKVAPPAATCPTGTDPNASGPVDQERPDPGYVPGLNAAFDQRAGRVVYVADSGETWTFDVCTNVWGRMSPTGVGRPLRGGDTAGLVYDVDSDVTVALGSSTRVYDAKTDTWTDRGPAPFAGDGLRTPWGAVYDTVSGLIITTTTGWGSEPVWEMWAYDVDTDAWTQLTTVPLERNDGEVGDKYRDRHGDFLGFSPTLDRFIFIPSNYMTVLADPRTGDATEVLTRSPFINLVWPSGTYGQAEDTVYVDDGLRICGFDSDPLTWTSCFERPAGVRRPGAIVGDPVNNRLVLINGIYGGSWEYDTDAIWAVDLDTGEWTQLLSPSRQ